MVALAGFKSRESTFGKTDVPGGTDAAEGMTGAGYEGWSSTSSARTKRRTQYQIDPDERGDDKATNRADPVQMPHADDLHEIDDSGGEGIRIRSRLARQLVSRVNEMIELVGDTSLPASITLFKRDLSACHDALESLTNESDFLSTITLVESALAQLSWKDYSKDALQVMSSTLSVGYENIQVSHDDYERACDTFLSAGLPSVPTIELDDPLLTELADGDET